MRTGTCTSTTTTNFLPVSRSEDPHSAFYSDSGLLIRVVTAGELPQSLLHRATSVIRPGSPNLVCYTNFREFQRGLKRVVTFLNPNEHPPFLWGFKKDAATNKKGEPWDGLSPGSTKKMTDPNMLREKRAEQKLREGSFFLPYTSGHINCDGFRLHKQKDSLSSLNDTYPELIYRLKPLQMHEGYLLDPKREVSFQRIAEIMANILTMEKANGNGNSYAFQAPVTLCMYDSYRGILLPPEKLDLATVERIRENADDLSQYERSMGMEGKYYELLAQSGCDRFLALLKDIPDKVKVVAQTRSIFPIRELEEAIKQSDADWFHDLLSWVDETLLNQIGLPEHLLTLLLHTPVITCEERNGAQCANQFLMEYIDNERLNHLMTDTFPKQARICRTLLKHGLFVPVIGWCSYLSTKNPLVVCLLVAHGTRAQYQTAARISVRGALTQLYDANKFLSNGLLTKKEAEQIRHDVLLNALCLDQNYLPCSHDEIKDNFETLVHKLRKHFLKMSGAGQSSTPEHLTEANEMCRKLLGEELWNAHHRGNVDGAWLRGFLGKMQWNTHRRSNVDAAWLRGFLEQRLSPQRYSDDELRQHLDWLSQVGVPLTFRSVDAYLLGKAYDTNNSAVTRAENDKGKDVDWLTALLATPPSFERREFARVGRYRAITQTAGQHYYQYHHPNSALKIATNGVEYVHRRFHGIDHALRTQMATEFLIEILPLYHEPFQQLLATYPALPELLKIAELYHDAVAEDEPKNTEELRAAELFERDMRSLNEYPNDLITLVATALRNKNSNEMSTVQPPFTADDQCSSEELLLRQVLRFGDVVDMLRLLPLPKNFLEVKDSFVTDPVSTPRKLGIFFDPQAIELLAVVDNPMFTRMMKAALLTFRDLAALTGGWHLRSSNPAADRYQLKVDNQQRRLLVEHSPDPYTQMREVLDDLVRLKIAKKADISTCLDQAGHRDYAQNGSTPSCWNKTTAGVGAYHKLHSEVELRQVRVPEEMTLSEKVCFASQSELPDADRPALSPAIRSSIDGEINRLRQEGIQPATGTPSQDELQQMYERPDSKGASILAERGIVVQKAEHEGITYFRMVKL